MIQVMIFLWHNSILFYLLIVAEVVTDVSERNVTEGGDSLVCVTLTGTSLRGVVVTLTSAEKSAKCELVFLL